MPGLEEFIRDKHPGLTSDEYQASEWALWLIVSSVQMYVQLLDVEGDKELEIESRVENYSRIFRQHFLERGVDPDAE